MERIKKIVKTTLPVLSAIEKTLKIISYVLSAIVFILSLVVGDREKAIKWGAISLMIAAISMLSDDNQDKE